MPFLWAETNRRTLVDEIKTSEASVCLWESVNECLTSVTPSPRPPRLWTPRRRWCCASWDELCACEVKLKLVYTKRRFHTQPGGSCSSHQWLSTGTHWITATLRDMDGSSLTCREQTSRDWWGRSWRAECKDQRLHSFLIVFLPQSESGWTRWVRYPWRDSAAPEEHTNKPEPSFHSPSDRRRNSSDRNHQQIRFLQTAVKEISEHVRLILFSLYLLGAADRQVSYEHRPLRLHRLLRLSAS